VSIDALRRARSIDGQWLIETIADFSSGFYWQQLTSNPDQALPTYAGSAGLFSGVLAAILNGRAAYFGQVSGNINPFTNTSGAKVKQRSITNRISDLTGIFTAVGVPLAVGIGSQDVKTRSSQGIQTQLRISYSKLYRGIAGVDLNFGDRFYSQDSTNQFDSNPSFFSKLGDQVYFDAGIRLVGGLRVPLLSYYNNFIIRDETSAPAPAPATLQADSQIVQPASGLTVKVDFTVDGAYPATYLPAAGSPLFAGPPLLSPEDARTFVLGDAQVNALRLLTLGSAPVPGPTGAVQIRLENTGSGLNAGTYQAVRILGVPLLNAGYATVDVTVDDSGQVSALSNLQGAAYLSLPEKTPLSGDFYLPLDVYQVDPALKRSIAPRFTAASGTAGFKSPVLSISASSSGSSGLSKQRLFSFDQVQVVAGGSGYQRLVASQSGDSLSPEQPASNDNAPYTYTSVPVSLGLGTQVVPLLGHDASNPATATVHLAGGSIRRVDLDQPLYITEGDTSTADLYSLALTLPAGIAPLSQASLEFSPSSVELSNLVEETDFSAQPGAVDTGVYLAAGQADQLALDSADGYRRLQNRVAYTSLDANSKAFTVYLNSSGKSFATATELTNAAIVAGTAPEFSFANHPSSISISGRKQDLLKGDTLVMWVEAGDPLIPYGDADGSKNYQAYLTAAYGKQALNYRVAINGSATNWQSPDSTTLYRPSNAIISDLQLFNVPDPRTGVERTLLVWSEISIDAIKGLTQEFGSGLSLPATIKATWINADSDTINWDDLSEEVVSIPWDPATSVGMGIADLIIATQTLKQADGTVLQTPLISWSQAVRTPYQESVLKDQPLIYLPMGGLAPGETSLNRGIASPTLSTTFASSTGLDFNVAGALAVEQTTAVRNSDGTGVLSTGLGNFNQAALDLVSQIPVANLPSPISPDLGDPPIPSLPYAIEGWVQLKQGSNPGGAGLVAMGQPSEAAVGAAELPDGWLLQSSFQVLRLSNNDAASLGLIDAASIPAGQGDAVWGWTWSVQADGANSTAMNGTGGSNLYANAVTLTNLVSGQKISGVEDFLASYGLTAEQLLGLDGTTANTMALAPSTSLAFADYIDVESQRATSTLNAVELDPSTTLLNQGFVTASDATANASLNTMLNSLWRYQQATGEAKVVFGEDPRTAQAQGFPDPLSPENYAGYALGFELWGGPAISVDSAGRLVFDVSKDLALTAPLGSDLRDDAWHYVAVSYSPTYSDYSVNGTTVQVPTNSGTASLFIDGELVASASVNDAYLPFNVNGQAQLLTHNAGGAIDHVAFYDAAINTINPNPPGSNDWPTLTSKDALAELQALSGIALAGSPAPGQIPGAVTSHWLARNVNPLAALQATFTSSYRPSADGPSWSWSEASGFNPVLAPKLTEPSASRSGSPSDAFSLSVQPADWASLQSSANSTPGFNPSGQELLAVSVTLTDSSTGGSSTIQLSAEQVLMGPQTIAALQPRSTDPASRNNPAGPQLHYTVLNARPELTLLIPRADLPSPATTTAKVALSFRSQDSASPSDVVVSTAKPLSFLALALADQAANTGFVSPDTVQKLRASNQALATAAVLEAAPLQLKYIDSGQKFSSEATASAANDPASSVPAESFGASQVAGSYRLASDDKTLERGWIAIARTISADAPSNLAGRVWVNYSGLRPVDPAAQGNAKVPVEQAPSTWLNALAQSNFDAQTANLPLLNNGRYPSNSGGLLITADETLGIDANLGQVMLNADLDGDGNEELIIAAPQASGGGRVYIISGKWIADNLNSNPLTLDLANPTAFGADVVTILQPGISSSNPQNPGKPDRISFANFGSAMAVDPLSGKLWIGAPQYVRELPQRPDQTKLESLVAIGALYSFDYKNQPSSANQPLTPVVLGATGTQTTQGADIGSLVTTTWGAQLGIALAFSASGQLAVSAPGTPSAQEFYGTDELIQQTISGEIDASQSKTWGSLYRVGFAAKPSDPAVISQLSGTDRKILTQVDGMNWKPGSDNVQRMRTYITNNADVTIASPTLSYNQALQTDAVGAVFLLSDPARLAALTPTGGGTAQLWAEDVAASGGASFYGSNILNTLGSTGFGSSLAFADLANLNRDQLLIGADSTSGTGAVLAIDPTTYLAGNSNLAIADQPNSYMAYQAAFLNLLGAQNLDQFGRRLVSLGDVNKDGYDDVLATAPNSRSGAGSGYVIFGSDLLSDPKAPVQFIGSVAPGSIGVLQGPAGPRQAPILEEIGYGPDGQSGSGAYGRGDVDGDGYPDVMLGSGGNGSAYVTWGKPFLSAIDNLALEKLSSSNGFLLDGLASKEQGSLRSIGDFNDDGYDDFISIQRGPALSTVHLELGAATQDLLAIYPYNFYNFTVSNDTQVVPIGDSNGDGFADIALFIDKTYSADNQGAGSSTGILYGRSSDKLPIGSGFGMLAPAGAPLPQRNVVGCLTDATPAFLTVGTTIYSVVKGVGDTDNVWFNQSRDGGSSWDSWTNLTNLQPGLRTASGHGPALCFADGRMVLGLLDPAGLISLSSWDPSSEDLSQWTAPTAVAINGQPISSNQTPQLVAAGVNLALLWVDASGELRSSTNTDPFNGGAWQPAQTLQERLSDGSSRALRSITAPSLSDLGDGLVALAVAEDDPTTNPGAISRIRVLANLPNSLRWAEASSFEASGSPLATGPSLARTDTGLALTYGTADQAVVLQRLDLLDLDGTSLNTADPLKPQIQQSWQATNLSGLSSVYGTVPLVVNGTLLLGNVRSGAENTQIWVNAIPASQRSGSSVWIDSSVQLSDGNGGWLVRQQAGADHPVNVGARDPGWQQPNGGLSPWAPSYTELNGVLYASVRGWISDGSNKQLYWNRSFDDGLSWNGWQKLPDGMTSDRPPTIAAHNGQLWLVYVDTDTKLNYTTLADPATNSWNSPGIITDGSTGSQTAEFATLVDENGKLALYYVGTGKNSDLYSTTKQDNNNTFTKSTLIKYNNARDNQTGSGPLAAARVNGATYLAYQGGTTSAALNTVFLTTGSAEDDDWTLITGVPQPGSASHTGVGLAANSKGLVLSTSDVVDGRNTISLQQGTGSGSSWAFSQYTLLQTPENSAGLYDGANSLYAKTSSDRVLVSRIDSSANEAIFNSLVGPLPASLVLTPEQTRSTLTPVGDLTGDGLADMLITANNVVQQGAAGAASQLQTGVRLVRGAVSGEAFSDDNANGAQATSQTLQLAPAQPLNAELSSTAPTAAASLSGLPQLTISALNSAEVSRITTLKANQSLANFTASASESFSLNQLFQGATATLTNQPSPLLWGKAALRSSSFGDLNGDGLSDLLAVDGLERIDQTAYGALVYALWDIRAAGDVNGNGVDDVLLALVPKGPAYRPQADGSPSFIQPVLLDGSLFEVDKSSSTFSLDRLKAPLNPYTQAEVFDLASTSSKDYLPPLQAWINPILGFKPGTLIGAAAGSFSGPSGASQSAQILVDQLGREFVVYPSGITSSDPSSSGETSLASQLRLGYRNADGSWTSRAIDIGVGAISAATPSAVFYGERLYVAYADQNGTVRIAYTTQPIAPDSDPTLWSWGDYAVSTNNKTLTTLISPTLVANNGRLTLITPANDPATGNAAILLAFSSNPEAGAKSAWGYSFDADSNGFSGEATALLVQAPDGQAQLASSLTPVAATVFQGRTVLAYANAASGLSGVVLATEPLGSASLNPSTPYSLATTSIGSGGVKVNGVSLATDQALLYLAHTENKSERTTTGDGQATITTYFSSAYLSGFNPGPDFTINPPAWEQQTTSEIAGVPRLHSWQNENLNKNVYLFGNSKYTFPSSFDLALQQGSLLGWGQGSAELNTSVTAPTQVSLAGYSIDGNIDINGDGFKDVLISDPTDPTQSVDNQYALFGGDYLNIASQVGTNGDDVLVGTSLADVIYTIQGADQVYSNGGADVIYTGAGDDSISIKDYAFIRIDAGAGFNSLQLQGNADQRWNFAVTGSDAPLWAPVANGGSSNQSPAMVRNGNTIYMARCGLDSYLYWTQSTDGGQSWDDWQQLPNGMTSNNTPSLAVVRGDLYLAYVGEDLSVYVTQFYGNNQWDDPQILNQDNDYYDPTPTRVKNGSGQLAAIAETVDGAEGLAIYYVDATSGDIIRKYNNGLGDGIFDLNNAYWEYADLFPAYGTLAVTEFNGSTYMAQVNDIWESTDIYSPGSNDPAISSNWNYIATKTIGNSSGISLSSIPKAVGETSSGLLLNTTDFAGSQQVTYLLADAIPGSSFQPFSSRPSASAAANQQTASILAIPAKENSQRVLLEAVADASRAATVSVSTSKSNNPEPGIFSGTQLKNIQLISSIDYGTNTLVFDVTAVNAINPDRVLFLTPDGLDFISLSDEFSRNQSFDTSYGGSLWYAYAAGPAVSSTSNPTLVYVLVPADNVAASWLSEHVIVGGQGLTTLQSSNHHLAAVRSTIEQSDPVLPTSSQVAGSSNFGDGFHLVAYRSDLSRAVASFAIERRDTSTRQVVAYASSSANSSAQPGLHYIAVAGLLVFEAGQSRHEVTVPINLDTMKELPGGSLSLEVEELVDRGQSALHLLIEPDADGSNPSYLQRTLSGFSLSPNPNGSTASLGFRADTDDGSAEALNLNLRISTRTNADTLAVSKSQKISIHDFNKDSNLSLPVDSLQNLSLDLDTRTNKQVKVNLELNLQPKDNEPLVSLLGPAPLWQTTVQLVNGTLVRFQQDAPLTSLRADSGAGLVTFGLESGPDNILTLISNAQGGSAGSLNSNNVNGATSWQTTEGKAIGSRSITDGSALSGTDWSPTASLDGVSLALLNLAVDGNQVTASFEGGVTGVFWQADGNAPSLLPVPVSVEVQRLAGFNNSLGFYSVDSITGMVAGINPGETGYLQAALARSQEEDLLLDARTLPAFGATATFNFLPLDTRERYGVLLLQNGDETKIFSSFAAANEGGATQMVSLSNSSNSRVLGIEDMSVARGLGDNDFNDIMVNIQGVSVGLF
jgi:hypothetical protein